MIRGQTEPHFVRLLEDPFGVNVLNRITPLYLIMRNSKVEVTIAQGSAAVDSLRQLLLDIPNIVGARSTEEFLIGYSPIQHAPLAEADLTGIVAWQGALGDLYRLGLSRWLNPGTSPSTDELQEFRAGLVHLFMERLDPVLHVRVAYWARRRPADSRG